MTLWHLFNVAALAYGPHIALYYASNLADLRPTYSLFLTGFCYFAAQFFKVLLLGFIGLSSELKLEEMNFLDTFIHSSFNALTMVVGVWISLKIARGNNLPNDLRILTVAISWSFTEALVTYFPTFWVGARGMEFSWSYFEMAVSSNIDLLTCLSVSAWVFLMDRRDLGDLSAFSPIMFVMLALELYSPVWLHFVPSDNYLYSTILRMTAAFVSGLFAKKFVSKFISKQK